MRNRYRNVAFLAELLINILVFSISCAILAGLFGQAGKLARETREKSFASQEIYSLFETLRARGPEGITQAQPDGQDGYALHYDEQWNPAGGENAAYIIHLYTTDNDTGAGVLREVTAHASNNQGEEICTLTTKTYHQGEGGGA
ncbi:type II secretion system GspH family protein [Ruminococcaceae bacterium OttesenSCG-928-I18]|nr:type II secretion system GspH family protein [Ruminococcaceae bacterium OttesenSCG-928-I18]